jgi:hypothetical protein
LALVVTVATHEATATGRDASGAQLTGSASRAPAPLGTGVVEPAVKPYLSPKLISAVPVGPGAVSKPVQMVLTSPEVTTALDEDGIPQVALEAYTHAANVLAVTDPSCHLPWQLLAAIGRVESDDGRFGGSMLLPNGDTTQPILGIPLDGSPGVDLVRNADGGIAQAEGPMQFLPSTWAVYGADGNGDGKKDINNIFDAALGAADFLCAGGGDMANPAQEAAAVFRYNNADDYVRVVLALAASYEDGDAPTVPTTAGPVGSVDGGGGSTPALQPVSQPSSPDAEAPAPTTTPTTTPVQAPVRGPVQTPTPSPTAPSSPTPAGAPAMNQTATPTEGSSGASTTTAPATPAPTATTAPGPTPSDQPSQAPTPSTTPSVHTGQTVDIGWAPAMRQVVVKLLTEPTTAPSQPVQPTHPVSAPAEASADTATTSRASASPGTSQEGSTTVWRPETQ